MGATKNQFVIGEEVSRKTSGIYIIESNGLSVETPIGGVHYEPQGTVTGAIKIRLPVLGGDTNTMQRFDVKIYNWWDDTSISLSVGGLNGTSWSKTFAQIIASRIELDLPVRFGHDGVKGCVWIGDVTHTWKYPQVKVTDFMGGFNGQDERWAEGWDISLVTSLDTVQVTKIANLPASDANKTKNLFDVEHNWEAAQNFDGGATAPTPVTPTDDSKEVVNVEYLHGKALSKTANIQNLWTGTQAEYDALTPDANTLYFIQ